MVVDPSEEVAYIEAYLSEKNLRRFPIELEIRNEGIVEAVDAVRWQIENWKAAFNCNYDIYFGLTNQASISCKAFSEPRYTTTFSVGSFSCIWNAANYLLSDPGFFPEIDGDKEIKATHNCGNDPLVYFATVPIAGAKSEVRRTLAGTVRDTAYNFLISHELTHLMGGHTTFSERS